MYRKLSLGLAGLGLVALGCARLRARPTGAAQADVITQSDAFGFATTNWTHTLGALSQFDSTLGP